MRFPRIDYANKNRWYTEKLLICRDAEAVLSFSMRGLDHGQIARCLGFYATYVRDLIFLTKHEDVFLAFKERDNAPLEVYCEIGRIKDTGVRASCLSRLADCSSIKETISLWREVSH